MLLEPKTNATATQMRQRILGCAWKQFAVKGFAATTMASIAQQCELELHHVFTQFPQKNDLVFELYKFLALQLEERVVELPAGTLATRFRALLQWKIASLEPHKATLEALFEIMRDPNQDLGVMSTHMEVIRRRVRGVFASAAWGAEDRPQDAQMPQLVRHLYRLHLGLVFLWFRNPAAYRTALAMVESLLSASHSVLDFAPFQSVLLRLDALIQEQVEPHDENQDLADRILGCLFRHRRLQHQDECATHPCPQCLSLHHSRVREFIRRCEPIQMVLPAFPAKSPNRSKVLGDLPDTAEDLALRNLHNLCLEIRDIYPIGANIVICSDGHVFADLVSVPDEQVTRYNQAIQARIEAMGLDTLSCFDLEDIFGDTDYPHLREVVLDEYSESVDTIRERVQRTPAHRHLFDGLHRFLFEDQVVIQASESRNRVRRACKELTYGVMQRSNAWGRLLGLHFPEALRLSIHPQSPHSEKIGIQFGPSVDNWVTPWHGVAVLREHDFVLMKRQEAEALGARLVYEAGRPTHFIVEKE